MVRRPAGSGPITHGLAVGILDRDGAIQLIIGVNGYLNSIAHAQPVAYRIIGVLGYPASGVIYPCYAVQLIVGEIGDHVVGIGFGVEVAVFVIGVARFFLKRVNLLF